MQFNRTRNYVYQKCVERVNKKRGKKRQIELYKKDKSLVSSFFNCNCTNNNRYLITKLLIDNAITVFGFKDEFEVLWGDSNEFNFNLDKIFENLIKDIKESECSNQDYEIVERVLCEHITYAFYSSFAKLKKQYNLSSTLEYFCIYDEKITPEKIDSYLDKAIAHLYKKTRVIKKRGRDVEISFAEEFRKIFLTYAKKYKNYKFFDNRLEKDFIPELLLLMNKYSPEDCALGLRIKWLIENDIVHAIELIDNQEYANTTEHKIMRKIVNASSSYVVKLEEISKLIE